MRIGKARGRTNLLGRLHRIARRPARRARTWYSKVPNTLDPNRSISALPKTHLIQLHHPNNPTPLNKNQKETKKKKHTPIPPRHTPHHHNTPIPHILNLRIRIIPLLAQFAHRGRRILEREKRPVRVGLEAFGQIGRGRVGDGGGAQEPGTADPDVESAPGVEDVVDEGEGAVFGRGGEGVGDYFCVGGGGGEGGRGGGVWGTGCEGGVFVSGGFFLGLNGVVVERGKCVFGLGGIRFTVDAGCAVCCG